MNDPTPLILSINGEQRQTFVQPWHTLLHVLRDVLHLTGSKRGCNQGICGACSVLIDGQVVRGCLSLAVNCTDREITTIEGLGRGDALTPVQQAFVEHGAVQCGFCTPGMIIASTALLNTNRTPNDAEIREGLSGNLCRCTGYAKVIQAVKAARPEATS